MYGLIDDLRDERKERIRLEKKIKKLEARKYFVMVVRDGSFVWSLDGPFEPKNAKSAADQAIANHDENSYVVVVLELEKGKLDWVPYNPKGNDQPNW